MSLPSSPLLPRQSYMMPLRCSKRSPGTICIIHSFNMFQPELFIQIILPAIMENISQHQQSTPHTFIQFDDVIIKLNISFSHYI